LAIYLILKIYLLQLRIYLLANVQIFIGFYSYLNNEYNQYKLKKKQVGKAMEKAIDPDHRIPITFFITHKSTLENTT